MKFLSIATLGCLGVLILMVIFTFLVELLEGLPPNINDVAAGLPFMFVITIVGIIALYTKQNYWLQPGAIKVYIVFILAIAGFGILYGGLSIDSPMKYQKIDEAYFNVFIKTNY